ncbi:MAG: site-specific integrase [Magnetococcales bacterium]|nr:site-specific integrase [Magnetococcales bacterium]
MSKSKKIGPVTIRPQVLKGVKTGKWFLDIPAKLMPTGQRKRKLFENRKQAADAATRLKRGLETRSLGFEQSVKRSGVTLKNAFVRWKEKEETRVRTLKKRASSLETDGYRLQVLEEFYGTIDLTSVTEDSIVRFQEHRINQSKSPATINSDVRTLLKVLRWAKKSKIIIEVPDVEQIPEFPKIVHVPTMEEVGRLIDAIRPSVKPIVQLMAETGCRAGEAFNLTWDCVDEINGWVEFKPKDGWTPKTRQSIRRVPVGKKLLSMFRNLPKRGPYVFHAKGDPNKPRDNIRKALGAAILKAGLVHDGQPMKITPHVLRKAFATWQANSGTPQRVLQALLGHAPGTRVTDQHYVQATDAAKRTAAQVVQISNQNQNAG